MARYPLINQRAASPEEINFATTLNNSTSPSGFRYDRRSDAFTQANLLRLYKDNKKGLTLIDIRLNSIEGRLSKFERSLTLKLKIKTLSMYELRQPLEVILEPDDGGFIARSIDLPLFGYGEDTIEAIDNLKHEVESLYSDLMEDDNFSEEWLRTKKFLKTIFKKK
jgi:hypothetical protein